MAKKRGAVLMCDCSGGCSTCLPKGSICVGRGNSVNIAFTVHSNSYNGPFLDISNASEILFIVADSFGGTVRIEKRLSDSEITISTNLYQFVVPLAKADTDALVNSINYYEAKVVSALGQEQTVSSGVFRSPDTMGKDI